MAKVRFFDLAKELGFEPKKLQAVCNAAGISIRNPLASVDDEIATQVRSVVDKQQEKVEKKDNIIRSMKDLPSISSEDIERGKIRFTQSEKKDVAPSGIVEKSTTPVDASSLTKKRKTPEVAPKDEKTPPIADSAEGVVVVDDDERRFSQKKRSAMTEFERQQAKIQKRKKLKEKQAAREIKQKDEALKMAAEAKILHLGDGVSVSELATHIGESAVNLIKKLFSMGIMATINQRLDPDTVSILAQEYGFSVEEEIGEDELFAHLEQEDDLESRKPRDPIVTIMGHVDHGKTTLLDYIRNEHVAAGEAGGITQHIGAYKVQTKSGAKICFLDTPGHEAFTAMRAHGALITDIAVLVVAADDGVKPQTIEAMNHAKNAGVPIVVAITKIDKPGANIEKVYEGLGANGLLVEAWGGKVSCQPVSGVSGDGVGELLDVIGLQAELMELGANPDRPGIGRIVEAGLRKGFGAMATVLVQSGTVRVGDVMVSGSAMGRVRSMMDERGTQLEEAGPSTPVEIAGFSEVPQFADRFYIVSNEKIARILVSKRDDRLKKMKAVAGSDRVVDLESLFARVEEGKIQELNVIVKADVHGSVVALSENLEKIHEENIRVKVIHSGVGPVSESDIMLASTSGAIIICFHVRNDTKTESLAEEHRVQIRNYRIIYEAMDDIEKALRGMLKPKFEEVQLGRAVVREVFTISKIGRIAGCFVESGKIVRGAEARLVRDSVEVYRGKVENINRFKDTVSEVLSGYECGINIKYSDIKPKDQIEVFENIEVMRPGKSA